MKTVKVRIPVCIAADGRWNAVGWKVNTELATDDGDMEEAAIEGLENDAASTPEHTVWITAEVPVPEPRASIEVEGSVE